MNNGIRHFIEEGAVYPEQSAVTRRTAEQSAQNIATPFV